MYVCIYMYIYIYIYRERERIDGWMEGGREEGVVHIEIGLYKHRVILSKNA